MPLESAVLLRIQTLGLADPAMIAAGQLRAATLVAIRAELARPRPWWVDGAEAPPSGFSLPYPLPNWARFEPVALLGEGGMGRVFKAFDPVRQGFVALKFLRLPPRPGALDALLEEAHAQAALDHPHVVRLLEAGEIEGLAYLVLAHVDGASLEALRGRFSLFQQVALLEGAARGVDAIHRMGIVHRDLKPANILVRRSPEGRFEALVTDFGVARDLHHAEDPRLRVVGTPHYMSPEQARGDFGVDRRSDVYALGASLYHLLLGAPPIPGPAGPALLARVVTEAPVPPRALAPDFPEELETVLLRCLAKDPADRYATAQDLAEALARCLAGRSVWDQA